MGGSQSKRSQRHKEPTSKQEDTSEDITKFVDAIRPFFGNGENDDLLIALATKLITDELEENKALDEELEVSSQQTLRSEPYHRILKQVSTVEEVMEQVNKARDAGKVLRVAGSEHAPAENIFPDDNGVALLLCGELRHIEMKGIEQENGEEVLYCRVGGGCYLGHNPNDPASNVENGLSYQLQANGFAFGITGGITHQSVGGYMTTGADGGSIRHSFAETVEEIEFVDGSGKLQTAKRGSDLWCAFGVSLGLLGVVTHVTFRLKKTYLVEGVQNNVTFADSYLGPDKETGQSKLKKSIEDIEYFHMNWFPQKYVKRVMQWTGKQVQDGDIIPFHNTLQKPLTALAASLVLVISNRLLENAPNEISYKIIGKLLREFAPLNKPEHFRDQWNKTLPSDNQAPVDTIMKVDFTEIWLPLDQCQPVMDRLQKLYADNQEACGNFATEVYCAKSSPFWLSMAYDRDVVRVDPYWYHFNTGDKRKWFSYVWDILLDLPGARCHWGKYLPKPGQKCGNITFNIDHLKSSYPKMEEWLKMREKLDPKQVFLSEYWRGIFNIPKCS